MSGLIALSAVMIGPTLHLSAPELAEEVRPIENGPTRLKMLVRRKSCRLAPQARFAPPDSRRHVQFLLGQENPLVPSDHPFE